MKILFFCLFVASQLALQFHVVVSNVTPKSAVALPLIMILTALPVILTYGCLIASTCVPPNKMPGTKRAQFVKIAGETGFWYTFPAAILMVCVALASPESLDVAHLWAILWQSIVGASLVNGLFAVPLTKHFLNQQESASEDQK